MTKDEEFQANTVIIDLQLRGFAELEKQYQSLIAEDATLRNARYYLKSLMETIDAHPELYCEWENFLTSNDLPPCPSWPRDDYIPRSPFAQTQSSDHHNANVSFDRVAIITATVDNIGDEDDPIYAQRNLIDEIKGHSKDVQAIIDGIMQQYENHPGHYYMKLQRHIRNTPSAMDAWKTLLMMIKLTTENPIRGITHDFTT